MIRVNLLRQQEKTYTNIGATSATGNTATNFRRGLPSGFTQKIAGFLVPVMAVYIYNYIELSKVEGQINNLEATRQQIEAQATALQPELNQIAKYKADKETIQKEVDEIKGLSLGRYRMIKILDTIQTILPQKAWISNLDIKGNGVNLTGNATEDIAISSFIEELDRSLYFKDISWIDSREAKAENGEMVKLFKLSFKLENL